MIGREGEREGGGRDSDQWMVKMRPVPLASSERHI